MVDLSEHKQPAAKMTERERARIRVEKKHKLRADFGAYVVINLALVVAWALTGFGYFWPGWILGIWGVFLLLDAWNVYYRRAVTEDEIDEELHRNR
jgi:hypothetical protein